MVLAAAYCLMDMRETVGSVSLSSFLKWGCGLEWLFINMQMYLSQITVKHLHVNEVLLH